MLIKTSVVNLTSIDPLDALLGLQKNPAIALIRYNDCYSLAGRDLKIDGEDAVRVESVNVYPLASSFSSQMCRAIEKMEILGFVLFK